MTLNQFLSTAILMGWTNTSKGSLLINTNTYHLLLNLKYDKYIEVNKVNKDYINVIMRKRNTNYSMIMPVGNPQAKVYSLAAAIRELSTW